jgi:TolB protein
MNRVILSFLCVLLVSCGEREPINTTKEESKDVKKTNIHYSKEKHLQNIKQLTFGGDNAEAYFSFDNTRLVFQLKNPNIGIDCDQIYVTDWENDNMEEKLPLMVSTGLGRTTCSYFMPGDTTVIYASTHLGDDNCPKEPEKREDGAYVWPIYSDFDIFVADLKGNIVKQLTNEPGYDAEATISPQGDKIVFTSDRTGDLELYTMDIDGSNIKQVTFGLGYDGGAFFSPDGTKLIFRSSRPKTNEEIKVYKQLLSEGLVKPTEMELFICNTDGSDLTQITNLGNANWAPFFHPSGDKVIFSSNHKSEKGFPFNLFMINIDGTDLEQITFDGVFDAFPMFSYDGKKLVFSSNRNNGGTRATNLFIADWKE